MRFSIGFGDLGGSSNERAVSDDGDDDDDDDAKYRAPQQTPLCLRVCERD